MQSILAELSVPGCDEIKLEGGMGLAEEWVFPCGLRVADDLVCRAMMTHGALRIMHNKHHEELHSKHDWFITETVTTEGNGFTLSFECSCE